MELHGTVYNASAINALVLYVGAAAIQQIQKVASQSQQQQQQQQVNPITHSAPMNLYRELVTNMNSEGRYLLLNAIANQLRYPNNQTHYFSCVLLYLFSEATDELIQEQITRYV